jgi:MFS family permease
MQSAIVLTWLVYNLYLPKLLAQFGFPLTIAAALLAIENSLAIFVEPLMGVLSDRRRHLVISRYPFIIVGVVLASALFISLPAMAIFGDPTSVLRWVFLGVVVVWSIAMGVFRSPALALLQNYAFQTALPQAASIVMLAGIGVSALNLLPLNQLLLPLNPLILFAIASLGLLAAAAVLMRLDARIPPNLEKQPLIKRNLGNIFLVGVSVGLGLALLRRVLNPQPSAIAVNWIVLTLVQLATLMPAGAIATRFGNRRIMSLGLAGLLGSLGLFPLVPGVVSAVALGISSGLVVNGTIPLALELFPPQRSGLGIGLYFGGAALANSVLGWVTLNAGPVPVAIAHWGSGVAFSLTLLAIALSQAKGELRSPTAPLE